MTREEQIRQAARIRADQYSHPGEWNDCYRHFSQGAEWADRTLIERVCEWLESINTDNYMDSGIFQMYDLIQDFKKAMEE